MRNLQYVKNWYTVQKEEDDEVVEKVTILDVKKYKLQ